MRDQDLRWLPTRTGAPGPGRQPTHTVWHWLRFASSLLRYPVWPALLAAVLMLVLLLSFQRVVAQGVVQGEQRRNAVAAESDDLWRCRRINRPDLRRSCLARLGGV